VRCRVTIYSEWLPVRPPCSLVGVGAQRFAHVRCVRSLNGHPGTPECRAYFCVLDMPPRDRTGWLGRQDSNLRISIYRWPFEESKEFPRFP
jgi:hypothetical protein